MEENCFSSNFNGFGVFHQMRNIIIFQSQTNRYFEAEGWWFEFRIEEKKQYRDTEMRQNIKQVWTMIKIGYTNHRHSRNGI